MTSSKKKESSTVTAKKTKTSTGAKAKKTSSKANTAPSRKQEVYTRSGLDRDSLREDIKLHLRHTLAKDEYSRTQWDEYRSVVLTLMDRLHDKWLSTQAHYHKTGVKRVYYLSMEY